MKLLILIIALSLFSCKKCEQCTRQWKHAKYSMASGHRINGEITTNVEIFEACGSAGVKDAEKGMPISVETLNPGTGGNNLFLESSATCDCK